MSESTLSLTVADLRSEIGWRAGYGRDYDAMDVNQKADVSTVLRVGLRQFYFPKMLQGDPVSHKWSFLTPQGKLTTAADVREYDLPDDCASLNGRMTYEQAECAPETIEKVGIGQVNEWLQKSGGNTSKPNMVAIIPKKTSGILGQRFAAVFAPTPDGAYLLSFQYNLLPGALTDQNPYPYGGAAHAETILSSCLAALEGRLDGERGQAQLDFEDRLRASISVDVRDFAPEHVGYNADRSDFRHRAYPWQSTAGVRASYRGVFYP